MLFLQQNLPPELMFNVVDVYKLVLSLEGPCFIFSHLKSRWLGVSIFDSLIFCLSVTIELIWIPSNFVVQNSNEFTRLCPDFV